MMEEKLKWIIEKNGDLIISGKEGIGLEVKRLQNKIKIKDLIVKIVNKFPRVDSGSCIQSRTKYIWIKMRAMPIRGLQPDHPEYKKLIDQMCLELKRYTWTNDSGIHETILFGFSDDWNHLKIMIPRAGCKDPDFTQIIKNIFQHG